MAGTDVALSPEGLGTRLAQMVLHYPCTDVESINVQGLLLVAGIDAAALSMQSDVWGEPLF